MDEPMPVTPAMEDTITTLLTQLNGRRAIFEGNAVVWAEEPGDVNGLWKQRLRWARGNVQVNRRFRGIWFRRRKYGRLGGFSFGLFWYATFLMPAFMITSSISLVCLYLIDYGYSLEIFRALWMINVFTYVVVTAFSMLVDPATARKSWRQAIFFPGFISLLIIIGTCFPPVFESFVPDLASHLGITLGDTAARVALLFAYVWLTLSMVVAWLGKLLESNDVNWGFDAQANEYADLIGRGIIDPAKVVRTALQDAASVSGLLITTEAMVAEKPKKESPMPAGGPGGGMGGMGDMDF